MEIYKLILQKVLPKSLFESITEETEVDSLITDFNEEMHQTFIAKNGGTLNKEEKEEIERKAKIAAENTIKQQLKSRAGLEIGNVKEIPVKDVIDSVVEKIGKERNIGDSELKTKINDLTEKYAASRERITALEEELESEKTSKLQLKDSVEKEFSSKLKITELVESQEYGIDNKVLLEREKRLLTETLNSFDVGSDGSIKTKDGSPVLKDGDVGTYKNASEFVKDYMDKYNLGKKSNSGSGGGIKKTSSQQEDSSIDDDPEVKAMEKRLFG